MAAEAGGLIGLIPTFVVGPALSAGKQKQECEDEQAQFNTLVDQYEKFIDTISGKGVTPSAVLSTISNINVESAVVNEKLINLRKNKTNRIKSVQLASAVLLIVYAFLLVTKYTFFSYKIKNNVIKK